MNTIKKILGTIALSSALTFGYNANAQEKSILTPTKVATETSLVSNSATTGASLQRLEVSNNTYTFKFDHNEQLDKAIKPNDIALLYVDKLFDVKDVKVGASYIYYGNYDKNAEHFFDAYLTKHFGKTTATLDLEKSVKSNSPSREYAALIVKAPKVSASFGAWAQKPFIKNDENLIYFGLASFKGDHTYAAVGNKVNTGYAAAGIHDFKDFGEFAFVLNNREAGTTWIKSQTAFGDVSKGFYSNNNFEVASDFFAMPAFFPLHFSPLSTKGTVALKLEYKNNSVKKTDESEIMLATNKTPIAQVGVGINTMYSQGKSVSDVALELYKEFKFKDFTGSVEYRYNNRTHESTGYVKMMYKF